MDVVFRVVCVLVHLSFCRVDPRCGLAIVATGGDADGLIVLVGY